MYSDSIRSNMSMNRTSLTLMLMLLYALSCYPVKALQTTNPRKSFFSRKLASLPTNNDSLLCLKALPDSDDNNKEQISRRQVMNTLVSSLVIVSTFDQDVKPANAYYTRTFPDDLDFENGDTSRNLETLREEKIRQQKANSKNSMDYIKADPLTFRGPKDLLTTTIWGAALWCLSGSRSNPIVTPLANALYDEQEEEWLQDRNEGMFASVPPYLYFVLSGVFFFLGVLIDRLVLLATEGDANVSLQLASVSLIAGGSLELGRIFSGEKNLTRQELDREMMLEREFDEFAEKRLVKGGNCHRSEVVKAFRRYYAKVRPPYFVRLFIMVLLLSNLFVVIDSTDKRTTKRIL